MKQLTIFQYFIFFPFDKMQLVFLAKVNPLFILYLMVLNPLSANPTKWSNKLKQFVGKLQMNCLTVFDHFVGLALKGLINVFCNWYVQSFFPEVVSENSYFDDLGDSIKRLVLITYIAVVVKIC